MPEMTPRDEELARLRSRWEENRQTRVFLQLAEEYRKLERFTDAIGVLEEGLEVQPSYLSARVSLGRCHLDAGTVEQAASAFERVLSADSTHLVASKLLFEARLQLGDLDACRRRLDLYRQLNPLDEELDEMEGRLRAARASLAATPLAASPPAKDLATVEPPVAATPSPGARVLFPLPTASRPALELSLRSLPGGPGGGDRGAPFPGLARQARGVVYRAGLRGSVLREVPRAVVLDGEPPALVAEAASGEPAAAWRAARSAMPVGEGDQLETAGAREADEVVIEQASWAEDPDKLELSEAELVVAPEPVSAVDAGGESTARAGQQPPAAAMLAAPEALIAAPASVEASTAPVEAIPETTTLPGRAAEPASTPTEDLGEGGTATLGEIYLRQGHVAEAAAIFRRVLTREPDNGVARRGLESIVASGARAVSAGDLLGEPELAVTGVTERKVVLLTRYLRRLRRGGRTDVP